LLASVELWDPFLFKADAATAASRDLALVHRFNKESLGTPKMQKQLKRSS
jgi:hypothetical protein